MRLTINMLIHNTTLASVKRNNKPSMLHLQQLQLSTHFTAHNNMGSQCRDWQIVCRQYHTSVANMYYYATCHPLYFNTSATHKQTNLSHGSIKHPFYNKVITDKF